MPKFFKGGPVDDSFFTTAPLRLSETFNVARPASSVWADLCEDNPLRWCRILDSIEWTSPRPFGVGTTRTANALKGTNILHEEFFIWEEGRRMAFYVLESSSPLFKRFAEDYVVEPTGERSCTFTWTLAGEPTVVGKAGGPVNRLLLGSLLKDTRKHYAS